MIKYYKLFDMLNRRGIKRTKLLEIISSGTLAKLGKGDIIKTDILDKICIFLNCQPGDIMECIIEINDNESDINNYEKAYKQGLIDEKQYNELKKASKESVTIKKPILSEELPNEFEENIEIEQRKRETMDK